MTALCLCGCGQPAPLAKTTNRKKGTVQGQQLRFVHGHNGRVQEKNTSPCAADGCEETYFANGYCRVHESRVRKHGTPFPVTYRIDPVAAFWNEVDRSAGDGGCWVWTGAIASTGYGQVPARNGVTASGTKSAHRASYELLVGEIPEGAHLDHLCRNPPCVNPQHLEPVTPAENTRRGLHGVLRTHCSRGHELTAENTYLREADNSRRCRTCSREEAQQRRLEGNKSATAKDACKHGHPLVGDNIKMAGQVVVCRECARRASREYLARKRAKTAGGAP